MFVICAIGSPTLTQQKKDSHVSYEFCEIFCPVILILVKFWFSTRILIFWKIQVFMKILFFSPKNISRIIFSQILSNSSILGVNYPLVGDNLSITKCIKIFRQKATNWKKK